MLYQKIKRFFDFSASAGCILLFAPLLVVIYIASFTVSGHPVIFFQKRSGKHGKPFTIYKFRTMKMGAYRPEEALTKWGRFLRKLSLDELPQLFNILKGDMSFVGPRPLLPEYNQRYSSAQAKRLNVRPGLSGWAQIKGRNLKTWEESLKLDSWYVENQSFYLDFKILFLTPLALFKTQEAEQQREEFNPSKT